MADVMERPATAEALKDQVMAVGTPAVVVDLAVAQANIANLQRQCEAAGVGNRPHMKTHKSKHFAKAQIEAGAIGLACQKLGEAEAMLEAGITDLIVCTNIFGAARSGYLEKVLRRADAGDLKLAADSGATLTAYARAAEAAGRPAKVMVECDTGRKRAGVVTPAEAVALAKMAADDPFLAFAGLLLYPPGTDWPASQAFLDEVLAGLASHGIEAGIISSGGTPNVPHMGALKGVTEHRSGTSIFNDRMMVAAGVAGTEDCALTVYTTLVSRAEPHRGILDAGSKTLTSDTGGLEGHGLVLDYPDAVITGFSEEHGQIEFPGTSARPEIGEVVRVIPNHVCVVVNMVDRLLTVRDGKLVGEVTVDARGRLV